jgi:hypothetical protein
VASRAPAFMWGFLLVQLAGDATGNLVATRFWPLAILADLVFASTLLLRLDLTPAAAPIGPRFGSDLTLWTLRRLTSLVALAAMKPQFRGLKPSRSIFVAGAAT